MAAIIPVTRVYAVNEKDHCERNIRDINWLIKAPISAVLVSSRVNFLSALGSRSICNSVITIPKFIYGGIQANLVNQLSSIINKTEWSFKPPKLYNYNFAYQEK